MVVGRGGGMGGGLGGGRGGGGFGNTVAVSRDYRETLILNSDGALVVQIMVVGGLGRTTIYKRVNP